MSWIQGSLGFFDGPWGRGQIIFRISQIGSKNPFTWPWSLCNHLNFSLIITIISGNQNLTFMQTSSDQNLRRIMVSTRTQSEEIYDEILQILSWLALLFSLNMTILQHVGFEESYKYSHIINLKDPLSTSYQHLQYYRMYHSLSLQ